MADGTATSTIEKPRIKDPPKTLREFIDYMGPAWIFTASQIGGGEVLSVPVIAAYLGMDAIWLVPLVGFTKIFGQYYLTSQAVITGDTFLQRLYEKSWWMKWIFVYTILGGLFYAVGISGHLATTAGAFQRMLPVSNTFWMVVVVAAAFGLVVTRTYEHIEKISLVALWLFLILVTVAAISVFPPISDWVQGLTAFPGHVGALGGSGWYVIALSFGWTGAGFASTVSYIWFVKDKGMGMLEPYSKGNELDREDLTDPELDNLQGWYRVVFYQNVIASVLLVGFSTALWIASAQILHPRGIRPEGFTAVSQMAQIFTQTYGPWSAYILLIGVSLALFSSMYAPAYGISRLWEDAIGYTGFFEKYDVDRAQAYRVLVGAFLLTPLVLNLWIGKPLILFAIGGILFAPIVGLLYLAAIYLLFTDLDDDRLKPDLSWTLALALFAAITTIVASLMSAL